MWEAQRGDARVPLTDQRLPVGSKDGDGETAKGGPTRVDDRRFHV